MKIEVFILIIVFMFWFIVPFIDESEENLHSFQVNEAGQHCDYEPGLEFDDTELAKDMEDERDHLEHDVVDVDSIYLESPDELIEENFEEAFKDDSFLVPNGAHGDDAEDFDDISKYGIVEVAGDDMFARKVITIYACRLPNNKTFNHHRFLRFWSIFSIINYLFKPLNT